MQTICIYVEPLLSYVQNLSGVVSQQALSCRKQECFAGLALNNGPVGIKQAEKSIQSPSFALVTSQCCLPKDWN